MDQNNNQDSKQNEGENDQEDRSPDVEEDSNDSEVEKSSSAPVPEAKEAAPETTSNLGEKTTEFAASVKESTTGALNKLNDFRETSSGKIIVMTIVGILVVGIIAFLLYYIIQQTMVSQSSYQLSETSSPVLTTQITNCDGSPIPNPSSGVRSGMCFWIYIYDISKYQGSVRHVFHRGLKTDGYNTTSGNTLPSGPYVALDPTTSSLYVAFGPNTGTNNYYNYSVPTGGTGAGTKITNNDLGAYKDFATPGQRLQVAASSRGIVFPYIPLQRWVHVGVVVNENINGGTITGYLDGELVLSVNQITKPLPVAVNKSATAGDQINVTPIMNLINMNISNTGDVYVGGSPSDPIGPGFSGLVSRIGFFNYDMSAEDVYTNYQQGPINNPLAALGLPAYGLQSPVYKIG